MKKLSVVFLTVLLLTVNVFAVDDPPCIYSAKQESNTVTVRLNAPMGGLLFVGVYDAQTGQMRDAQLQSVGVAEKPQTASVRFSGAVSDTELVKACFLNGNSLSPFCEAMRAIIPVGQLNFVLNTNTKKFHYACCPSAGTISVRNRQNYYGTRESVVSMGYEPCNNCRP